MCVCVCVCVWGGGGGLTNAEDVEAEALAGRLVNQLVREAVKAYMARQGEVPGPILLKDTALCVEPIMPI